MIIDSHCHLSYKNKFENISEVIRNANDVGVKKFLNISTKFSEFEILAKVSKDYENIYYTLGVHPHEADEMCQNIIDKIKNKLSDSKLLAIGETGLDYYYNHSDKKKQIRSLEMHIELSQETDLPLVIHMRDSEEDMIRIFNNKIKIKEFNAVIHCFTGTKKFAEEMLDLGFYISASGIITFKKSENLRNIFRQIPLDKILVETDSPFLAPEPKRGKSNEPANIIHTIKKLSEIHHMKYEKMCDITTKNFSNLFKKLV